MPKKYNRVIKVVIIFVMAFFSCYRIYEATDANAGGGGGSSNSYGGLCTPGYACGIHFAHRIYVRLVYYNGQGEEVIGERKLVCPDNREDCDGPRLGWYTVGDEYDFNSDAFESSTVDNNNASAEQKRKRLIEFISTMGWNIDLNSLNKQSCEVDKTGNCYTKPGYRIVAELYIGLGDGSESYGQGNNMVSVKGLNGPAVGLNYQGRGDEISNGMHIRWADMGYACENYGHGTCSGGDKDIDALTDPGRGYGIWIVDISQAVSKPYDYSIDAACENCDSELDTNKAYFIQDTTNWEAVKASRTAESKNAQKYFYKESIGAFCREEYEVRLPNKNNKIPVLPGKYFTVNAKFSKSELNDVYEAPNFEPMQVTKKRECVGGDYNAIINDGTCGATKYGAVGGGKLHLKYNDTKDKSLYKLDTELDGKLQGGVKTEFKDGKTIMTATYEYTLKPNIYNRIQKKDGLSKGNDAEKPYYDVGISNLPISYENNNKVLANVDFKYELPKGDSCSKLHSAFNQNNDYFDSKNARNLENVYKKYQAGHNTPDENIDESACVKLYGNRNLGCIYSHVNNKAGKCYSHVYDFGHYKCNDHIKKAKCIQVNTGGTTVYFDEDGRAVEEKDFKTKCCSSDEDAKLLGLESCDSHGTGECTKMTVGRSWNPTANNGKGACCPVGQKYNKDTKKCEANECNPRKECCCPFGCEDMYWMNGEIVCPGPGGVKPIYRTIDLKDPFPGIQAKIRKTGSNWCSYELATGKLSCEQSNNLSKKVIIDKASKTYNTNSNGIYKITLDASTIDSIRGYNKNNKYDDFKLDCKDGQKCISEFVNKFVKEGSCANASQSNFDACRGASK